MASRGLVRIIPRGGRASMSTAASLSHGMNNLGTETAFEVLARAAALAAQGKSIVNLGIGQPDFKTPQHIVEAAIKALKDGHHGYTPAQGILPLREAVAADLLKRHNATVSPENILIVPGGKVTMFFAIMMFGTLQHKHTQTNVFVVFIKYFLILKFFYINFII